MKKKFQNIILLSLLVSASSCNKFLEKEPDSNRASISTPEQVSQLLISAYPKANYITMVEALSDNAEDKGQGVDDVTNRLCFKFEVVNSSPSNQDSPEMYWSETYKAIAVCNQALQVISKAKNPSEFSAQKGEALVARAYAHFMLVNLYSQSYDAAHAATDLGIPYVTEPENIVFKDYDRKTVAYVYEQIEKDLTEGLPLISDKSYEVPKYHFNHAAANAFASRFYLYKKDWAKAAQYANAAFPADNFATQLRPWNSTWAAFAYAELWNVFSRATTVSNLLLVETSSLYGRYNYSYRYGYTFNVLNTVSSVKSLCGNPTWTVDNKRYTAGTNNYLVPKLTEYFVRESVNANFGQPYVMVPVFDAEEVLFNRAEANAYLGNYSLVLKDLNTYVSKRIQNYNATTHAVTEARVQAYAGATVALKDAYIKAILDLKRLEFTYQGQRYFDMQRYGLSVTHILKESGTETSITVPARDNRRIIQIPQSATLSGLPLNPR
ncbi:RagB/SusD family nutrient uptake outer membrane protein [Polluticaenibacter yanchengensis]|uniref:RagB/SusD family nutrient uptake outer membrane protein n=1 Tax=Polluticaenibacter yanchengensis TaxID=3014562 RepID=A0ABT4UI76_9BACT|nr:RagB/SusD family nutrient uptake outer membrane protein [Chitinophagaceae bacterium LY-5]